MSLPVWLDGSETCDTATGAGTPSGSRDCCGLLRLINTFAVVLCAPCHFVLCGRPDSCDSSFIGKSGPSIVLVHCLFRSLTDNCIHEFCGLWRWSCVAEGVHKGLVPCLIHQNFLHPPKEPQHLSIHHTPLPVRLNFALPSLRDVRLPASPLHPLAQQLNLQRVSAFSIRLVCGLVYDHYAQSQVKREHSFPRHPWPVYAANQRCR